MNGSVEQKQESFHYRDGPQGARDSDYSVAINIKIFKWIKVTYWDLFHIGCQDRSRGTWCRTIGTQDGRTTLRAAVAAIRPPPKSPQLPILHVCCQVNFGSRYHWSEILSRLVPLQTDICTRITKIAFCLFN